MTDPRPDAIVGMIESDRPIRAGDLVSINDLAVALGVSIRTLRRWNRRPDAPKRYRKGRRLMYRRTDVQAWFQRSKSTPGAGEDVGDDGAA